HDSQARFPRPRVQLHTCEAILERLLYWAHSDLWQTFPGVCWLYGPAGIGKSATAQTVAEICEGKEHLVSFFFLQN
ncbi:hypothetical protein L218DRAFT_856600, partial [Marasmius fiardii PR-910]